MKNPVLTITYLLLLAFSAPSFTGETVLMNKVTANPCAAKNACNPCMGKNPCAAMSACNPCANAEPVDAKLVTRPKGTTLYDKKPSKKLVKMGKKLFKDKSLSTNNLSCHDCHETNHLFQVSFTKPYPHEVSMAKQRAGVSKLHADEFVQFCMVAPMAAKPLPWDSKELAALTAYVKEVKQPEFIKFAKANPCALKKKASKNACNPCAMAKNACNPCAAKNACNPCAAKANMVETARNPCAMKKNPCNPCAAKNPCSVATKNACNPCANK